MKTKQREKISRTLLCRLFRSRANEHDRMLVLNMSIFSFTDGWSRTFSKYQDARYYA